MALAASYATPVGDWSEGFESGFGIGGDVAFSLTSHYAVRAGVSFPNIDPQPEKTLVLREVVRDDLDVSVMRFYVAFQFYDWARWNRGGKTMWYVYAGMGAVSRKLSGSLVTEDLSGLEQRVETADNRRHTRYSATVGVGVSFIVFGTTGVQLSGSGDLIHLDKDEYNLDRPLYYDLVESRVFEFRLGLVQFL
ncbi:hypothetical protein GF377_08970 [candidate division GN15 bacterium]|nr:hypothetical protein [candidate division GN15 bacterium]